LKGRGRSRGAFILAWSLRAVRGIVIDVKSEKPQRVSITIGNGSRALGDSETVETLAARSGPRKNRFPPQAFVAVQLLQLQISNFAERCDYSEGLLAFQRKPMVLENRMVEI
jgi:hypothetical protein